MTAFDELSVDEVLLKITFQSCLKPIGKNPARETKQVHETTRTSYFFHAFATPGTNKSQKALLSSDLATCFLCLSTLRSFLTPSFGIRSGSA